jgi:hypothetical protein
MGDQSREEELISSSSSSSCSLLEAGFEDEDEDEDDEKKAFIPAKQRMKAHSESRPHTRNGLASSFS